MGFFDKLKEGLKKTKDSFVAKVNTLVNSFTKIDEDFFEELEETLILSDIGAVTAENICTRLRAEVKRTGTTETNAVKGLLKGIVADMLRGDNSLMLDTKPSAILVIGVNGAGKTTTIGKLAANLRRDGKKVIVAAADTFRAAAIDQLNVWTDRAGVDIIKHAEGSDPAAVVFDACTAAKARNADVLIIDTAGRLHNKKNLMDELSKINRIIDREAPDASKKSILIIDATTGQNAVLQTEAFSEAVKLDYLGITKLDGSAKGGVAIAVSYLAKVPIVLAGLGEGVEDLMDFDPQAFADALIDT